MAVFKRTEKGASYDVDSWNDKGEDTCSILFGSRYFENKWNQTFLSGS